MNGLAKGGLITLFVGNGIVIFISLLLLILGAAITADPVFAGFFSFVMICALIVPILSIIFGVLALKKSSDGFRVTAGVLGLVSLLFVWAAYFFPFAIILVGSILILCGKKQ